MSVLKFAVKTQSKNPTKTVVEVRGFKIIIDEPESLGGTNDGANPVEYVLAAFSGCLNVIGHIVAKEMGFTLRGIEFEIEGDLDPAKLFGQTTEERAGYKEIRVNIKPDTDANRQILEKWLEVMESRCPVRDNIANPTTVKIALK